MKRYKLDEEEKEILRSVEAGEWESMSSAELEKEKKRLQRVAENTLRKRKNINVRISEIDLLKLKTKALEEGLPYQTLIASILHKFVNAN